MTTPDRIGLAMSIRSNGRASLGLMQTTGRRIRCRGERRRAHSNIRNRLLQRLAPKFIGIEVKRAQEQPLKMLDRPGSRYSLHGDFGITPVVGRHGVDRRTAARAFTNNDISEFPIHERFLPSFWHASLGPGSRSTNVGLLLPCLF
jgi:hypothetical protein